MKPEQEPKLLVPGKSFEMTAVSYVEKAGKVIARDFLIVAGDKKYLLEVGTPDYLIDLSKLGKEYENEARKKIFPVADASDVTKLTEDLTAAFPYLFPYLDLQRKLDPEN